MKFNLKKLGQFLEVPLALLIALLSVSLVIPSLPDSSNNELLLGLLATFTVYLAAIWISYRVKFKFDKISWSLAFLWLAILGFSTLFFRFANFIITNLSEIYGFDYNFIFRSNLQAFSFSWVEYLLIILLFFVQTLAEEWVFRGWLLSTLKTKFSANFSIFLSAIIFGVYHVPGSIFPVSNFISTFCLAIGWGYVAHKTSSFFNTWPVHFLNNLFFSFILGYNQYFFSQAAIFKMDNLPNNLPWVIIFIVSNAIWIWMAKRLLKKLIPVWETTIHI